MSCHLFWCCLKKSFKMTNCELYNWRIMTLLMCRFVSWLVIVVVNHLARGQNVTH